MYTRIYAYGKHERFVCFINRSAIIGANANLNLNLNPILRCEIRKTRVLFFLQYYKMYNIMYRCSGIQTDINRSLFLLTLKLIRSNIIIFVFSQLCIHL